MNKGLINKLLPHFIAVVVFLLVTVIYCRPVLQGKVLNQSDVTQWKGMAQSSFEFKEKHGHFPLWTNSMFSGMPNYQIVMDPQIQASPIMIYFALTLHLPKPINYFFLACICFYFLTQVLRINPYIGIIGGLAYAFVTYNMGIIEAGHDTKMQSIALIPGFIGSLVLIYERKYLWGLALTTLFTTFLIAMTHLQIVYYALIIAIFMTASYLFFWIREKQIKHALLAIGIAVGAGVLGVMANAVSILTTLDAAKTTIRGGTELPDKNATTSGLSKDYALSYSMNKPEPLVMMVPNMYGGSGEPIETKLEESKAIEILQTMPQEMANQIQGLRTAYWGGLSAPGQVAPNAPPYIGSIICFLALIGFFILNSKHKWWVLGASVLAILMSWGEYFYGFNSFLLEALPMYNKFRVPSMILVIPTFLFCMMAVLTIQKIVYSNDKAELWDSYKKGLMLTGGVFLLLLFFYFSADFLSLIDEDIKKQAAQAPQQAQDYLRDFFNALKEDRKSLFMQSFIRSFFFIAIAALLVWLQIRKKIQSWVIIGSLGFLAFIDIMVVDSKYLNEDHFTDKEEYNQTFFTPSAADEQIKKDTGYYRVFDRRQRQGTGGAMTSYFHNSVEGYHAAKLSIYQDLIEHQLNKLQSITLLNMLNTKYILQSNEKGEDVFSLNDQNLGPAWFVNSIRFENTPKAVMDALTTFNPKDTAIVFAKDKSLINFDSSSSDTTGSIQLVSNLNDLIHYTSNSNTQKFAVFSEVYYDKGWKAYIDDKETPIIRTNYVLRGLVIPAGKHNIRFEFHPESFYTGKSIAQVVAIVIWLLLLAAIANEFRKRKKVEVKKVETKQSEVHKK